MGDDSKDLFGLAPYGRAAEKIAEKTLDGAGAFIGAICMPVAKEFGLYLRDYVSNWRKQNAVRMLIQAEALRNESSAAAGAVHPKTLHAVLECASWQDDGLIGRLWAGLLASAVRDGDEADDRLFVDTLKSLTSSQCRLLLHGVESTKVRCNRSGLLAADPLFITIDKGLEICGHSEVQRLDRELDDLNRRDLIVSGIDINDHLANIAPRALTLHLVARCISGKCDPVQFFKDRGLFAGEIEGGEYTSHLRRLEAKAAVCPGKFDKEIEEFRRLAQNEAQNSGS